ncbi:MAG: hypothetical protein ACR2MO_11025 [Acidimicrobiales bacterium]
MAQSTRRCPVCGFDAPSVGPADAAAAAHSFPRRHRGLLVRPDEDDPEIVHRSPGPGEPSALDHAAAAAEGMAAAARALTAVQVHDGAAVDLGPGPDDAVAGASDGQTLEDVLAHVTKAAGDLAGAIESVHGDGWARTGLLPGAGEVHALDIARAGVHAGSHHLRAAERTLARARLLPR